MEWEGQIGHNSKRNWEKETQREKWEEKKGGGQEMVRKKILNESWEVLSDQGGAFGDTLEIIPSE